MRFLSPVFYPLGLLLLALSGAMFLTAWVDVANAGWRWSGFFMSAFFTGFAGAALAMMFRGAKIRLTLRQGFLLTVVAWFTASLFGALPFIFGPLSLSLSDAVFESVSGLTTTGSTVLSGLNDMPASTLIWRSFLQWLGGIGIIGMSIALLPFLQVGGMQLFEIERSDGPDKVLPRPGQIAAGVLGVYVAITVVCAVLYDIFGMSLFEAANHAMTTIATGGFAVLDSSFGGYGPAAQWTATFFMAAASMPFLLYLRLLVGGADSTRLFLDSQVRLFLLIVLVLTGVLAVWLMFNGHPFEFSVRQAAFNIVSVISTTGFASADYTLWGTFPVALFFIVTFIGGCTGSTSGGIKIFRFEILSRLVTWRFQHLTSPNRVIPELYGGKKLPQELKDDVATFFALFVLCFLGIALALALMGLDFTTALSGAATAVANVGPGLGEIIGPAGNFSTLPGAAKWLLAFGMLLGRLELFPVLVFLSPAYWRR